MEVHRKVPNVIRFYRQQAFYGEFSNFYPAPITIGEIEYPTTEHYFQAEKFTTTSMSDHERIRQAESPGIAAKLGRQRSRPLRPDWEQIKDQVMYTALEAKFTQHARLRKVLLATGEAKLIEHTRNDRYWADGGDGSGRNMLGILLMRLRDDLRGSKRNNSPNVIKEAKAKAPEIVEEEIKEDKDHVEVLASRNERAPLAQFIPRVQVGDKEGAKVALDKYGVCIFSKVAEADQLAEAEHLFWSWIEGLGMGFNRNISESLANLEQLGYRGTGIISKYGIGQTDFMWYCRTLPKVRGVFETLWGTSDLVTSFDGCAAFRNPWARLESGEGPQTDWVTRSGWYHLDQNFNRNPNLECYQGLLNFFPAEAATGATVVVPKSHRRFQEVFQNRGAGGSDFVNLSSDADFGSFCTAAVQAALGPGDFLAWDSRVIHCSQGVDLARGEAAALPGREGAPLARLAAFVCMVPAETLGAEARRGSRGVRREFFQLGLTSGHNPYLKAARRDGSSREGLVDPNYGAPAEDDPRWSFVVGRGGRNIETNDEQKKLQVQKKKKKKEEKLKKKKWHRKQS